MYTKLNVKLIIILGILILLLPNLLRSYDARIGEQSYFYERIIEVYKNNLDKDALSFGGRGLDYDLGPIYLLLFLNSLISMKILLTILPYVFGLLTIILFNLLLKKLNLGNEINIALLLLIVSPMFIYSFTSYSLFTVSLPLILLTLYLFLQEKRIYKYASNLFLFLLAFFDYRALLTALLFMLIYLFKEKKSREIYPKLFISFIAFIVAYLQRIINYGVVTYNIKENKIRILISELGSNFGISFFLIFFLFFGLGYLWKSKYKYMHIYISLILMILLIVLDRGFIIYFSFLIFYLASLGITYLFTSKWESEVTRKLTIILLITGLLFSSYSSLIAIKNSQPTDNLKRGLDELKALGSSQDVVFSHYKYGILINSLANKKNFIDTNFAFSPDFYVRYNDMQEIFYSRNADKTKELLDKHNIKYILITKEMKEGLVWNNKDEGLLFVLENAKEFRKTITNDEIEIWRVR